MKKITALLVLLSVLVSASFASTLLTFPSECTVVGSNGRTIRKTEVEIDAKGIVVIAEESKITAQGDGISVIIGENTIATILDDGSYFTLYVVTGEGAVVTSEKRNVRIYTPTTLTEAEDKGSYYVRSTENEEYIFNHSSSDITTYDAIRGTSTVLEPERGYNIITKEVRETTAEKTAEIEIQSVRVPAAPLFVSTTGTVTTAEEPVITAAERTQSPEEVEKEENDEKSQTLSSQTIRVTQTLVDIEDESEN